MYVSLLFKMTCHACNLSLRPLVEIKFRVYIYIHIYIYIYIYIFPGATQPIVAVYFTALAYSFSLLAYEVT